MDHHLIREKHQREFCPYCRQKINGDRWKSEWHNNTHYKTIVCRSCDKEIWLSVDFDGDGNDTWDGNGYLYSNNETLDMKLKEAEPKIKIQ